MTDPMHDFERLSQFARTESAPNVDVANAVMQRVARAKLARVEDVDRSRLWFAAATTAAALVVGLWLWPSTETTLESYALLWSPLGGALP